MVAGSILDKILPKKATKNDLKKKMKNSSVRKRKLNQTDSPNIQSVKEMIRRMEMAKNNHNDKNLAQNVDIPHEIMPQLEWPNGEYGFKFEKKSSGSWNG